MNIKTILICFLLCGCTGGNIGANDIQSAIIMCSTNSGLSYVHVGSLVQNVFNVHCNNNATFTLIGKEDK